MRFSHQTLTTSRDSIAQLINTEIRVERDSVPSMTIKVEAANVDYRGKTQILVKKSWETGDNETQWIDENTLSLWLQMNKELVG